MYSTYKLRVAVPDGYDRDDMLSVQPQCSNSKVQVLLPAPKEVPRHIFASSPTINKT